MIFNHIQIKVADLEKSRPFYDAIMSALSLKVVLEIEGVVIGYGNNPHDMFEIRQSSKDASLTKAVHIAFNASSKKVVEEFYNIAIKNGAKCNGKPGYRPEYESGYYAAFVIDPNGHNLEVIFSKTPKI